MAERVPNRQLAALIAEAGFSHAGLARRVDQLGLEHGIDLRYDKTSVTRWLRGQQPRGATPALIAEVFTRRLGRRFSAQDLGLETCAPVYAGLEFAASPAEAVEIASSLWRKDTGLHSDLHRVAFTPAGLVVPSRDWLIGRADERVARGEEPSPGAGSGSGSAPAGPGGAGSGGGVSGAPAQAGPGAGGRGWSSAIPRQPGPGIVRPGAAAMRGVPGRGPVRQPGPGVVRPGGGMPVKAGAPGRPGAHGPGAAAPVRRGEAPGGAAPATGASPGALPALPTAGFRGRVASGDVAAVHAVGELFRALDHAYGGGHARHALVRYLEGEAEPMLRGNYTENIGRALFGAVAELVRLSGWASFDVGSHGLAQRYYVQALRLSQAAGDRVHGGYILATMSRQAVHLGHGKEAVQLARVAQQGAGSGSPAAVQALMHATEAEGHALLGDERSCLAALARGEHTVAKARPGDAAPGWVTFFDEAEFADESAHCHLLLGRYRGAVQHAERSLRLRSAKYARSQALCRLVLANGWLGLGDAERACAHAGEAMDQIVALRSARAVERLQQFLHRLTPYRDTTAARALTERAGALLG